VLHAMLQRQHNVIWIAAALTAIAAILGVLFSVLVSTSMARPVRRLLEGTRAVEGLCRACATPAQGAVLLGTARSWRGIVPFTHLARKGRMTVTIGRRELLAALGGAAAALTHFPVTRSLQGGCHGSSIVSCSGSAFRCRNCGA
jgi:hypothetical protein